MHKNSDLSQVDIDGYIPGQLDALTKELKVRELTTHELAQIMGVADRRVSQLWENSIIPVPRYDGQNHLHPLIETVAAYISFLKGRTDQA